MTPDDAKKLLAECRVKIDDIDRQLVELLNRRTVIVEDIGRAKSSAGLPIYEPDRERSVFENVRKLNRGPLPDRDLLRIYERLIDVMRQIQKEEIAPLAADGPRDTELESEVND